MSTTIIPHTVNGPRADQPCACPICHAELHPPTPHRCGAYKRREGLDDLTPRQRDVLALVADGLTNAEIADALCVTTNTVKSHLAEIFSVLDTRTRTQAARVWHRGHRATGTPGTASAQASATTSAQEPRPIMPAKIVLHPVIARQLDQLAGVFVQLPEEGKRELGRYVDTVFHEQQLARALEAEERYRELVATRGQ